MIYRDEFGLRSEDGGPISKEEYERYKREHPEEFESFKREPVSRFSVLHCEERVPGQYELKCVFHGA